MKAARKLRNLQRPQALIDYVREFLTPRSGSKPDAPGLVAAPACDGASSPWSWS